MRNRDYHYLAWANVGAHLFSTCAKRQHMAIIIDRDGRVIGTGYNGSPAGMAHCLDGACPRLHNQTPGGADYRDCIAVHAEQNALLYSDRTARLGGTIYVTGPPCWECARAIAGSGLARVVTAADPTFGQWDRSREFIEAVGLVVVELDLLPSTAPPEAWWTR